MSPHECSLIIPASGFSSRFGGEDKLLVDLNGCPLADHCAQTAADIGFAQMLAVVPTEAPERAAIFKAHGFEIVLNSDAVLGQAHSIHLGAKAAWESSNGLCIMLADMPLVPPSHIQALLEAAPNDGVIKTLYEEHTQPPAIFSGVARAALLESSRIARKNQGQNLTLAEPLGADVDTYEDLANLSKTFAK